MPLIQAYRRCPEAVFLPSDRPAYDAASAEVMATLRSFPAVVEVWGWDEGAGTRTVDTHVAGLRKKVGPGWVRTAPRAPGDSVRVVAPGLGDGMRLALDLVDTLRRELPIDPRRLYLTGQSMGGGGAWHALAQQPRLFAAAVICCGTASAADRANSPCRSR